jgi:phosphatidylinositol kinase/protein kinase (PI-3  family)
MATISKGIVISASEYSRPFYEDLMKSIKTDYPIYICWEGLGRPEESFEIGAIQAGKEKFDEFIYLHDTVYIKDNKLFDELFAINGNVFLTESCYHYFGKYVSKEIPELPEVKNKEDAVKYELNWFKDMVHTVFHNQLPVISETFEEKYGRTNMRLENNYLIKFKARWS